MSELPTMRLHFGEEGEFDATPENTSLWRHIGAKAVFDHVFLQHSDEDENGLIKGSYIFGHVAGFDEMAEFMASNGYPLHVNLRFVARADQEAFDKMLEQNSDDLDSGVPSDWVLE